MPLTGGPPCCIYAFITSAQRSCRIGPASVGDVHRAPAPLTPRPYKRLGLGLVTGFAIVATGLRQCLTDGDGLDSLDAKKMEKLFLSLA